MAVDLGFTVPTQYQTVEFLGGTQTRDVEAVGIVTNGHGVYIEFRIPLSLYSAQTVQEYAVGYTGTVEALFGIPGVVDVQWSQAPKGGQLQDVLTYYVESSSGLSSSSLTAPLGRATVELMSPAIKKLRASLDASEALTG